MLSLELAGTCAALQKQEEAAQQLAARHEEAVRQVAARHEAELARVAMEVDEVADVLRASLMEAEGREARAGEEAMGEMEGREAEGRGKERTVREVVSSMQAEAQVEQVQDPVAQVNEQKEAQVNQVMVTQVLPLKGKVARKTATGKGNSEVLPVGGSEFERGRSKRSKRGVR